MPFPKCAGQAVAADSAINANTLLAVFLQSNCVK